jgi:hypothetical protein
LEGTEQIGVEVGHARVLAVERGDSIGQESVSLAKYTMMPRTKNHLAVGDDPCRLGKRARGLTA